MQATRRIHTTHTQWLLVRLSLLSWPIRAALRCGRCDERATSCSSLQMRCQPSRLRHPSQVCMGSLSRKHKLRVASIGSVAHAPPPPSTSTSMAADALLRAHSCPSERASRILVGSQSRARTHNKQHKQTQSSYGTQRSAAQIAHLSCRTDLCLPLKERAREIKCERAILGLI